MCRKQKTCTELGSDPTQWDQYSPLPVPAWFEDELGKFAAAVTAAADGEVMESVRRLHAVRSSDLREWYVEHGQLSGTFRAKHFSLPPPQADESDLDSRRSPDRYAWEVWKRDGFRCRYCGLGVVPKSILAAYSKVVGKEVFRDTGTNHERHGAVLAFRANADHVDPWNLGGRTAPENLVTACWACNYGKSSFTVEQLGLVDPRENPPIPGDWDGLSGLHGTLRAVANCP